MYRKALVDSPLAAVPGLWACRCCRRPVGAGLSALLGRARERMQGTLPVLLLTSVLLGAAPDPDIFDGRIIPQQQAGEPGTASGKEAPAAAGRAAAEEGGASESPAAGSSGSSGRDFSGIGQISSGPQVSAASSGGGDGAGDAAGPDGATDRPAASGSGAADSDSAPRDFSQIGGLSGADGQGVEVNSSKASPQPSGATGHSSGKAPTAPPNQGQGTGGSGSQPTTGNQSGDYGQTLPSGI